MGQKLLKFYELVQEEAGFVAKTRLAMKTNVPSVKAATEPDTPEMVAKFKAAFKEITGKDAPIN